MLLSDHIGVWAGKSRRRIAIGLDPSKPLPGDLTAARSFCDVVTVGNRAADCDFIDKGRATPEETLLDLLISGRVDGVIRGQLDHTAFVLQLLQRQRLQWSDLFLVSLLADQREGVGQEYWVAPVSNAECWIRQHKVCLVRKVLRLFDTLSLDPRVALISGVRQSDLGPQWYFDGMYYDCEDIVELYSPEVRGDGWIRHYGIETERALEAGANVLVVPNGMVGNH